MSQSRVLTRSGWTPLLTSLLFAQATCPAPGLLDVSTHEVCLTSGPLHWLVSLLDTSLPDTHVAHFLTSFKSLLMRHLLDKAPLKFNLPLLNSIPSYLDLVFKSTYSILTYHTIYLIIMLNISSRFLPLDCKLHEARGSASLFPAVTPRPRTEPGREQMLNKHSRDEKNNATKPWLDFRRSFDAVLFEPRCCAIYSITYTTPLHKGQTRGLCSPRPACALPS